MFGWWSASGDWSLYQAPPKHRRGWSCPACQVLWWGPPQCWVCGSVNEDVLESAYHVVEYRQRDDCHDYMTHELGYGEPDDYLEFITNLRRHLAA